MSRITEALAVLTGKTQKSAIAAAFDEAMRGSLLDVEERALNESGLGFGGVAGTMNFARPPMRGSKELMIAYKTSPFLHAVVSKISDEVAKVSPKLYVGVEAANDHGKALKSDVQRIRRAAQGRYDEEKRATRLLVEGIYARDLNVVRRRDIQRARDPIAAAKLLKAAIATADATEIESHPLLDLLEEPNPELAGVQTDKILQIFLDLKGEAFHFIANRYENGMPASLYPLPPHWVTHVPTKDRPYFEVRAGQLQMEVAPRDMLWLKHLDAENPYSRGAGAAQTLADEIETDEYASKHVKAFYYNHAMPAAVVAIDGAGEDALKAAEKKFDDRFRGFERAWRILFTNGKLNVGNLTQNFKDMQQIPLREFERDAFRYVYGMPPEPLGLIENSNRATAEAAKFFMASFVVSPRLALKTGVLQQRLASQYDERLILVYHAEIMEDAERKLRACVAMPSTVSKNEWRAIQGLPPREGWDDEFPTSGGSGGLIGDGETPPNGGKEEPDEDEDVEEDDEKAALASRAT